MMGLQIFELQKLVLQKGGAISGQEEGTLLDKLRPRGAVFCVWELVQAEIRMLAADYGQIEGDCIF